MRFLLAVVVCASLVLTPRGRAQQQQKPPEDITPTIQVEVSLVNLLCSVRDKRGGWITNLTKDDFTIAEDGHPQEIKYFTRETDLPLTIGLLVDVSGSQRNLIETERRAASAFFSAVLHKKDMAFLISFGSDTELLQDFTGSPRLLQAGLERLRENSAVGGLHPGPVPTASQMRGTVLYDAVYLAATDRLAREVGRKAIVLITDGVDMGSKLTLNQAVEAAQKSDAVIYGMYYVDPSAYYGRGSFGGGGGEGYLKKMAEETGGRVLHVDRKNTLETAFDQLQQELRSQYTIAYSSTNPKRDGSYRRVDIRTTNRDLKVQARKGYYATAGEK